MENPKGIISKLPDFLDHLKPHLIDNEYGRLSFFTKYKHYGPSIKKCCEIILQEKPNLVLISCFAFCYAKTAIEINKSLKILAPGIKTIIGGAGISSYPEFFIKNGIDYAISGESEISITKFMNALRTGKTESFKTVPNLYWKNSNNIITSSDFHLFTKKEDLAFTLTKTFETKRTIHLSTTLSRGCPKKCSFCTNHFSQGRIFRTVPLDKIKKYLFSWNHTEILKQNKKIIINFEDDNILMNPDYFINVLNQINILLPNCSFSAENGMDYTMLNSKLINKLIRLGFIQFNLSMVSSNKSMLKKEKRVTNISHFKECVEEITKKNIPCICYFICGLKNDTIGSTVENLSLLFNLPIRIGISLFYSIPGMENFTNKKQFDSISPGLCAGSSAYPWNKCMSTASLISGFRLARLLNLQKSNRTEEENGIIHKIYKKKQLFTFIKNKKQKNIIPVHNSDQEMLKLFFKKIN